MAWEKFLTAIKGKASQPPEDSPPESVDSTVRRQGDVDYERLLAEERSKNAALLHHSPDGVLLLDPQGVIVEVSESACRIFTCGPEDLIGRSFSVLDPSGGFSEGRAWSRRLSRGDLVDPFEQRLVRKNGREFPAKIYPARVDGPDGDALVTQVIVRDLTEREREIKESEDLLQNLRTRTRQIQTIFEVSRSIGATLDVDKLLNQTVEIIQQRSGYYYVGLFLVEGNYAVLAAGSGEPGRAMLESGYRLPVGPSSMVGWCIENRQSRIVQDTDEAPGRLANPLTPKTRSEAAMPLMRQGRAIGALTVQSDRPGAFNSEDVSVLQIMVDQLAAAVQAARFHTQLESYTSELEKRIQERTGQLEEVNRELESFSYSISHDLRTPLRAIQGYSNIVLEAEAGEVSDLMQGYVEKIRANAFRMGRLIDDLLALSRMGQKALRLSLVDPNLLIRELLEESEEEFSDRRLSIKVDPLVKVMADPVLLKQAFANLIGNAVKFTSQNEVAQVRVGCKDGDEETVFFVQDNGVGFDMRYAGRLAGVFQRLHHSDEFEGSGVGLAIVKRIIVRHGGKLWFDAVEGEGATFYFSLPNVESGAAP